MASVMEIVVKARDQASQVLEGVGEAAGGAMSKVEENIGKITAAGAVAGTAMEGFARKQAPLRESAQRLAAATGESAESISDLAREASNVTFPLDEVYASMEAGRQQGLESGEQLQEFAKFWDMVGDATGESGPALADAAVALQHVGIDAENSADATAALGYVHQETTASVEEFMKFVGRAGRELGDNTPHINDMAAGLEALEDRGHTARDAQRLMQEALRETDGDMMTAIETLGVSQEEFQGYREAVDASGDVIERNADIHADSYTQLQRVQHQAGELMNRYSGLFDVASSLALPLMALGPISKGVTMAFSAAKSAAGAMGKAMTFLAANPIVLVIAAVAALAVGIVLLWKHSETFRKVVLAVWAKVQEAIQFAWEKIIKPAWEGIKAGFRALMDAARAYRDMWAAVFRAVGDAVKWVWNNVLKPAWEGIKSGIDALKSAARKFADFWADVWDGIKATVRAVANPIIGVLNMIIDGAERVGNAIAGAINGIPDVNIPSWVPGIGGRSFGIPHIPSVSLPRIPSFHTGGVFRAPAGRREGLALLQDREIVATPGGGAALGPGGLAGTLERRFDRLEQLLERLANRPAYAHVSVDEIGAVMVEKIRRSQGI